MDQLPRSWLKRWLKEFSWLNKIGIRLLIVKNNLSIRMSISDEKYRIEYNFRTIYE